MNAKKPTKAFLVTGAYNPYTKGHEEITSNAAQLATTNGHTHFYTGAGASEGTESAPLSHDQKTDVIRQHHVVLAKKFKTLKFGIVPKENSISPFHQIIHLIEQGKHSAITIGLGSDQMSNTPSLRTQILSHMEKYGGFLGSDRKTVHKNVKIDFQQLGETRDEGDFPRKLLLKQISSGNITGIKAGKLRRAVSEGDVELAHAMMPDSVDKKKYFSLIAAQQKKIAETPTTKKKKLKENYNTWFCSEEFAEFQLREVADLLEAKTKEEQRRYQNSNKRKQRSNDSAKMSSNPFAGQVMIVQDDAGNVMLVDKHSYNPNTHTIVTEPDKMNQGAAEKLLNDENFVQTKTSIKLLGKVAGVETKKESSKKKEESPADETEAEESQPVAPPRPAPTKTDSKLQFPDSDHKAVDIEYGISSAFNFSQGLDLATQIENKFITQKQAEMLEVSQTLNPAAQRIVAQIMPTLGPGRWISIHTGGKKDQSITKEWENMGGTDNTSKTDIILQNQDTNETIRVSVKCGKAQLMSGKSPEAAATFYNALKIASSSGKLKESTKNLVKKLTDKMKSEAAICERTSRGPVSLYQQGGEYETKDKNILRVEQLHEELTNNFRLLFENDPDFLTAVVYEAMTGVGKFGEESPATATHILSTKKDGTEASLTPIDWKYAQKISKISKLALKFKSSPVETKDLRRQITELRKKTGRKLKDSEDMRPYSFWSAFRIYGPDSLGSIQELFSYCTLKYLLEANKQEELAEPTTEQEIQQYLNNALEYIGDDPYKMMEFLGIEPEEMTDGSVDFTEFADNDSGIYNTIHINGKEIRIPVQKDINYNDLDYGDDLSQDDPSLYEEDPTPSKEKEINESYISYALRFLSERTKVDKASGRDYKAEYEWQGTTEQKKNRAKRNAARRLLMKMKRVKKGDGKDVDHVDGNPQNNSIKNLRATGQSYNRSKK